MKLELDPERLRALRERIGMPISSAARRSGLSEHVIGDLESQPAAVDVETARKLAKAYNRNWYVFLLEDEQGAPALPRDFRRLGQGEAISEQTMLAFDDAEALIVRIVDLPREAGLPSLDLSGIRDMPAEDAATQARHELGVTLDGQHRFGSDYDAIKFWSSLLSNAGVYVAQRSFPYREVRAFCLDRQDVRLVVVSSRDSPRARVFSMLHELGHLLLGGDAMCRPQSTLANPSARGEEPFCNAFAAAVLMPAKEFAADPAARVLQGRPLNLGDAVSLARRYGVSELAALRRLATVGLISESEYDRLHEERAQEFADEPEPPSGVPRRPQPSRMINESSRLFASEILDAHARGAITYREIGVLLEGNLKHIPAIREALRG